MNKNNSQFRASASVFSINAIYIRSIKINYSWIKSNETLQTEVSRSDENRECNLKSSTKLKYIARCLQLTREYEHTHVSRFLSSHHFLSFHCYSHLCGFLSLRDYLSLSLFLILSHLTHSCSWSPECNV